MDWFLCDRDPRHERVRTEFKSVFIEIFFAEKKPPYFLPTFSKYVFSKIFHSLLYSFQSSYAGGIYASCSLKNPQYTSLAWLVKF